MDVLVEAKMFNCDPINCKAQLTSNSGKISLGRLERCTYIVGFGFRHLMEWRLLYSIMITTAIMTIIKSTPTPTPTPTPTAL